MDAFLRVLRLFLSHRIARYVISGVTANAVTLGGLYLATDVFGAWYVFGATMGFSLGIITSFFLQKLWTFEDRDVTGRTVARQAGVYIFYGAGMIFLNDIVVYTLVEYGGMWHLFAQIAASGMIAVISFSVYRFIFRPTISVPLSPSFSVSEKIPLSSL